MRLNQFRMQRPLDPIVETPCRLSYQTAIVEKSEKVILKKLSDCPDRIIVQP